MASAYEMLSGEKTRLVPGDSLTSWWYRSNANCVLAATSALTFVGSAGARRTDETASWALPGTSTSPGPDRTRLAWVVELEHAPRPTASTVTPTSALNLTMPSLTHGPPAWFPPANPGSALSARVGDHREPAVVLGDDAKAKPLVELSSASADREDVQEHGPPGGEKVADHGTPDPSALVLGQHLDARQIRVIGCIVNVEHADRCPVVVLDDLEPRSVEPSRVELPLHRVVPTAEHLGDDRAQ